MIRQDLSTHERQPESTLPGANLLDAPSLWLRPAFSPYPSSDVYTSLKYCYSRYILALFTPYTLKLFRHMNALKMHIFLFLLSPRTPWRDENLISLFCLTTHEHSCGPQKDQDGSVWGQRRGVEVTASRCSRQKERREQTKAAFRTVHQLGIHWGMSQFHRKESERHESEVIHV